MQPRQHTGNLRTCFTRQKGLEVAVRESADVELAAAKGLKQGEVLGTKKIEATVATLVVMGGVEDAIQVFDGRGRVSDGRNEFQVTAVRCSHQLAEVGKTVDGFFKRGNLHLKAAVPVFHPAPDQ